MSSEKLESLFTFMEQLSQSLGPKNIERVISALEQIAANTGSKSRSTAKSDEIDRRISHMLAWVEQTMATKQKDVAAEFSVTPSTISHERYEAVQRALAINRLARKRSLLGADVTHDDFVDEVLNE